MGNVWRAEEAWLVFGGGGQVPFWEKLIFCAGDLSGGGGQSIASVLYLIFLTNIVGLNPGWAGTVLMLSKMWDAVSAPLMGMISDNTRSPMGRRRPYILAGGILLLPAMALMGIPPALRARRPRWPI